MTDREWLDSLKVGDTVACVTSGVYRRVALAEVDRFTDTTIVVGASKYRKRDGRRVGNADNWTHCYITSPSDEFVIKALRAQRIDFLRREVELAARKCGDVAALEDALLALSTYANRPEIGRISSTTPPPGVPQVGTGCDVARECQTMSDPTAADRRGEDGECIDAARPAS